MYLCAKDHLGVDEIICSGGFVNNKNIPDKGPEKKILIADDDPVTLEMLEKNSRTKNIPVLFLTSLISEKEEFSNHTGNRRFLAKPIEREKLLAEIARYIGGSVRLKVEH